MKYEKKIELITLKMNKLFIEERNFNYFVQTIKFTYKNIESLELNYKFNKFVGAVIGGFM
jgi:hypothetical protein